MRGYIWCVGMGGSVVEFSPATREAQETPHFEETSPIWDYFEALQLESSRGGKTPRPSGKILLLNAWTFHISR